jgi:hypothetical protein
MDVKQLSEEVEQISQVYAEKFNIERDATWFILKLQEEVGELIQSYLMMVGKARAKGKSETGSLYKREVLDEPSMRFFSLLYTAHHHERVLANNGTQFRRMMDDE